VNEVPEQPRCGPDSTLGLAVATMADRLPVLQRFVEESARGLQDFDQVIIVVQGSSGAGIPEQERMIREIGVRAQVVASPLTGISRSRNTALEQVATDFLWFVDDDVVIETDAAKEIKASLARVSGDAVTVRIRCLEDPDQLYKTYGPQREIRRLHALKVSSIEIIVNVFAVRALAIVFPEQLGLGTALPAGEENLFLLELLARGGAIRHLPVVAGRHTCTDTRREKEWRNPAILRAKGIVARRLGLTLGLPLILRWWFRESRRGMPYRYGRHLCDGFFRSRRYLSDTPGR